MAKFKAYDDRQRVFLPVSLEEQLLPGTLEFAIHTKVDSERGRKIYPQRFAVAASLCQHPHPQAPGSLYPQRKDKSKYPVVTILHGAQHRKDRKL